jgi:hypothetical protein
MELTPAQYDTLKADILSRPELAPYVQSGQHSYIADFYNADDPTLADFWRTNMTQEEILNVINWTTYIARTVGERDAFAMMLTLRNINPSSQNIRNGFNDIFSGGTGSSQRAALSAAAKRKVSIAEKLFGGATVDGARLLVFEGDLTPSQIAHALGQG